ncbi:hypothetical protein BOX15_Mlig032055g3 [Macrostomum lignano]|uniref:Uncharacterized protein n=1 Tax=Macrostomum lignano TaxID=282301 RepID=A0A267E9X9_9PLAT|nr:hypothetical protein BOX15_Mlig032055g3 [Macrostomum lignano]
MQSNDSGFGSLNIEALVASAAAAASVAAAYSEAAPTGQQEMQRNKNLGHQVVRYIARDRRQQRTLNPP